MEGQVLSQATADVQLQHALLRGSHAGVCRSCPLLPGSLRIAHVCDADMPGTAWLTIQTRPAFSKSVQSQRIRQLHRKKAGNSLAYDN